MKYIFLMVTLFILVGCSVQEVEHGQGLGKKSLGLDEVEDHHEIDVMSLPFEDLSEGEIEALGKAIDDEFKARATYEKVIADFGEIKPFSNIINAEVNHINELKVLYDKYSLDVPEDKWTGNIDSFETFEDACAVGVEAEILNADLYDELFLSVDNEDITQVFTTLRDASRLKHLPAFERCGGK